VQYIKKYRSTITILLALAGIALMVFYAVCDTSCRYLKGDIWGIDLKWIGSTYMLALIACAACKQSAFVRMLLAAGLGVEAYLFHFQWQNDVYCPFCLAFALMVIAAFIVNYEAPSAWRESRRRMWLYFLGEVDVPMIKLEKIPLLIVSLLGYLIMVLTFSGFVTPAYADERPIIPFLGKGAQEVFFFSDYFCPPCQALDADIEPIIKDFLSRGNVKITFVDVPFSPETPLYARYYLYAIHAGADAHEVLRIRKALFHAAKRQDVRSKEHLENYLREQKIRWKQFDENPVFLEINTIMKQNRIDSTPTCIIKYSSSDMKKYTGTKEILGGLQTLKMHLSTRK